MDYELWHGDGWIVETDDGTVASPGLDAVEAERLRDMALRDSPQKVWLGASYGRVIRVTYVKGWWARQGESIEFDTNKRRLKQTMRELYG